MLTNSDKAVLHLMRVRTLLYATEIIANELDVTEDQATKIANLLGVITDEIDATENALAESVHITNGSKE